MTAPKVGDNYPVQDLDTELCMDDFMFTDNDGRTYLCTEPSGHEGDHVAQDFMGTVVAVWARGKGESV